MVLTSQELLQRHEATLSGFTPIPFFSEMTPDQICRMLISSTPERPWSWAYAFEHETDVN